MLDDMTFPASGPERSDRIAVNVSSRDDLLKQIDQQVEMGQGFSVATVNLDHLTKLRVAPDFRSAYQRQTYIVADGRPIVWFSRLAGRRVALVPGSELIDPVCALAARKGARVALLGATEETLEAAAADLEARHPGLEVVAMIAPPYGFDPTGAAADDALRTVEASGAQICFLALGAPKQEILAARAMEMGVACGFLSIGAGLDFIAGSQVRAPRWMRAVAMEWLWRLLNNPRRLTGRYLACAALMPALAADAVRLRTAR
ncbi:MAG: WecB/TagA/CpsF family glycosyltransferase [Pseudomonadota bacterium]